ncbi:MAG: TatD family hydrolase [Actinomycetota bacterium]
MWFDNHCHLTTLSRGDGEPMADEAVAEARAAGVTRLLTVGCTVPDSLQAAAVAERFDDVWSTAGVHPHDASEGIDGLEALFEHPSVVAVGECGLDFHYDHSPRDVQADVFLRQVELANRNDLALVIHTRDAWEETFDLLDRAGQPERTVFHCFTGGPDEASAAIERGGWLSFSGIVTFKNAEEVREAARLTPSDKMLVETDSPYLAPVPLRGKPNRPANVAIVGEFLADLLGRPVEEVAATTTANANTLFGLDG